MGLPRREDIDPAIRERLAKWLEYYKRIRRSTNERLAEVIGCSEPTVTNILNRKRSMGLDVLYKMHVRLHRSADELLDVDPPGTEPPVTPSPRVHAPRAKVVHESEAAR